VAGAAIAATAAAKPAYPEASQALQPSVVTPPVGISMAAVPSTQMFTLLVPQGVMAGQQMLIMSPDGEQMAVAIPSGISPGMQLQVAYTPRAQAMAVQPMAQPIMAQPMV